MASPTVSTQTNSMALESLPVEIQAHILRSLPDMKTLDSLLRASPQFLQVYQQVREDVISNIVCNQITPTILPLAVNVLQQSYLRSHRRSRSKVLEFLETFKQSPSPLPQHQFSLETSKKLLKTHAVVEHFADAFITDRLDHLSKYLPQITSLSAERKALLGPSGIEHHRLARAFYHLELYGILFYDPEFDEDVITVEEQSSLFLAKLLDWELEELICVREYMFDSLSNYLNQVEEDSVQDYIDIGQPVNIADRQYDFRFVDDEYWFFFSDDGQMLRQQYQWMERGLTRGLNTLQDIFQPYSADTSDDSREVAYEDALGNLDPPRNTMKQALDGLPHLQYQKEAPLSKIEENATNLNSLKSPKDAWLWYLQYQKEAPQSKIKESATNLNSLESPNDAWLWALKKWSHPQAYRPASYSSFRDTFRGLRCWGYIIWSNDMLETLGLLEKGKSTHWSFRGNLVTHDCYRVADFKCGIGDRERRRRSTVESRLRPQYESWRNEVLEVVPSDGSSERG